MAFPHGGVSRSYGSHASFAHFIPTSSPSSNSRDGGRGCINQSRNEMERNRACSLFLKPFGFKSNCVTVKRRFLTNLSLSPSASASSTVEKSIMDAESNLIDALIGIQGRGRGISAVQLEAAASVANASRILFQFDRAAFSFKFLPFKVPYPVPFCLLGDEAKGWLETTYLSPSGNIRISKGNKGTTFVLQKQISKRQRLLEAVSSGVGVEKIIEELIDENPTKNPADLQHLAGKWRLIWSSQGADANWLQKSTIGFPNWQIVEAETGRLQNVVQFFPGLKLRARARSQATSLQRRDVNIEGASLEVGSLSVPLKIMGAGFTEVLYLDKKIRITRGDRGSTFVHIRDD